MSDEVRQEFEDHDLSYDQTISLFEKAYGIEDDRRKLHYTYYAGPESGDRIYGVRAAKPAGVVKYWMEELYNEGYDFTQSVEYINTHLQDVVHARETEGPEAAFRAIYGDVTPREAVDKAIQQSGMTKGEFAKVIDNSEFYGSVNQRPYDDVSDRMIARFGVFGAVSHAQALSYTYAHQLGNPRPDKSAMNTPINKSLNHISAVHHIKKSQAMIQDHVRRFENRQSLKIGLKASVDELKQSKQASLSSIRSLDRKVTSINDKFIHKRDELERRIRTHSYDRINRTLDRDLSKAAKNMGSKAQQTRVERYWNSEQGRTRASNIMSIATTLSHTTRKMHGDARRARPSNQDIKNAEKALYRIRQSGSISQAVVWREMKSVIQEATDQSSKKKGVDLEAPRMSQVFSKAHGKDLTKRQGEQSLDLNAQSEAFRPKEVIALRSMIRDVDIKHEGNEPEKISGQEKDVIRAAIKEVDAENGVEAKPLDHEPISEEEMRGLEDMAYEKDSNATALEHDHRLDETKEIEDKEALVQDIGKDERYPEAYLKEERDISKSGRGKDDQTLKAERDRDTEIEHERSAKKPGGTGGQKPKHEQDQDHDLGDQSDQ